MPSCYRCHAVEVPRESDLCPSCESDEIANGEAQQETERRALLAYPGDRYLVDGWLEDGVSIDEAKGIVEDPSYIAMVIDTGQLEAVLADKFATAVLRKSLIDSDKRILRALNRYASRRRVREKPGRKPKGRDMLYDYERVYNLRKSCLTFGKIAQRLWHDSSKYKLASALYYRAVKQGFPRIPCNGDKA
jgi:hypothetical protein